MSSRAPGRQLGARNPGSFRLIYKNHVGWSRWQIISQKLRVYRDMELPICDILVILQQLHIHLNSRFISKPACWMGRMSGDWERLTFIASIGRKRRSDTGTS